MPGSLAPVDMAGAQVPHHFRCPISLELMRDPVTVSTGQTYDRASIESWVATGNTTCPVTRAPLSDSPLIPNHTLRRLIHQWCAVHRPFALPKPPADPALVLSLVAQARSDSSSEPSRLAAARSLHALAGDSDENRHVISTAENRAALLSLAFEDVERQGAGEGESPIPASELALQSLSVLSMLQLSEQESASVASRPDRLAWLAALLCFHPSAETRVDAAAMVEAVSAGTTSQDLRAAVGSTEGLLGGLVRLLLQNHRSPRAAKVAIRALFSLCLAKQNREWAVSSGAAESLVDLVAAGALDCADLERALAAVELLCRTDSGRQALAAHERTVGALVKAMAAKASDRAAEHAVGALAAVCTASEAMQREVAGRGAVAPLLVMVQGGCTERAKRKAQALLKLLLRAAWPRHDPLTVGNADDFQLQPALATATFLS